MAPAVLRRVWVVAIASLALVLSGRLGLQQSQSVGDLVESQTTGLIGEIHRCGANHLIVVTEDGIMFKSFIHDVQAIQ